MLNKPTLLTIAHDPRGSLFGHVQYLPLQELFDKSLIVISSNSDLSTFELVVNKFDRVIIEPATGIANARKSALYQGLELSTGPYFYCDLDRLVYWYNNYPNELKKSIGLIKEADFTIFGRTQKAFDTHPDYQFDTENEGNVIFGQLYGEYWDVLAGARGMYYHVASKIYQSTHWQMAAQDLEWCFLAQNDNYNSLINDYGYGEYEYCDGKKIAYHEVSGLGYESQELDIIKPSDDEKLLRDKNLESIQKYARWHRNV